MRFVIKRTLIVSAILGAAALLYPGLAKRVARNADPTLTLGA